MEYRSLAMSFRIQLGFHAANNEGAGGTNVMEPRRITVGDKEYDGISGEIIRHHILENFVKLCQQNSVGLHDRCKGLVPDRGKEPVKDWITKNATNLPTRTVQNRELPFLDPPHYPEVTRELLQTCALCDTGGYLIALETSDNAQGTLKRDSCFEVGWLITEHPAVVNFTQHSAYDPDPQKHNLFVQNMRNGIYSGVLRLDLDRIGFNDWWWLQSGAKQYAIDENERKKRIRLLLTAIRQWLLSPTFAKQTSWLQHMSGLLEGVIVLSKDGPAPFYSPIRFEANPDPVIKPNPEYRDLLKRVQSQCGNTLEVYFFDNPEQFKQEMKKIEDKFSASGGSGDAPQASKGNTGS